MTENKYQECVDTVYKVYSEKRVPLQSVSFVDGYLVAMHTVRLLTDEQYKQLCKLNFDLYTNAKEMYKRKKKEN